MAELHEFVVVTENGERTWMAEDADHAREQHDDAFRPNGVYDPGEKILDVYPAIIGPEDLS